MRNALPLGGCLSLIALTISLEASAGPARYTCIVKTEQMLSDEGVWRGDDLSAYVDKEFHVDRESGLILGDVWSNSGDWTREVVHAGDKRTSFKVLSISRANLGAFLTIDEWADGDQKPFIYAVGRVVLTGTCE